MAITAYTGLPGHGKSYTVFKEVILPNLAMGRNVWTNIPFNKEALLEQYGIAPTYFSFDDMKENPQWFHKTLTEGAVVVIDELWRIWGKTSRITEEHKEFLAEHRHIVGDCGNSTEIVFVTQDLNQLTLFARELVETTYRTIKLNTVGATTRYRVDVYEGAATGQNPPKSQRLRQIHGGKYEKKVYKFYKSHTKSKTGAAGLEGNADDRGNVLSSWGMKARIFAAPIAAVFMVWFGIGWFQSFYGTPNEVETIQPENKSAQNYLEPEEVAPEIKDPLSGFDLYISFNLGNWPLIKYAFTAKKGQSYFKISESELVNIGYSFKSINSCLVILEIGNVSKVVSCRNENSRRDAIVDFNFQGSAQSS